jgi:hypothetical protein
MTTSIKKGDDILYYYKLNYIDLFNLRQSVIILRVKLYRFT